MPGEVAIWTRVVEPGVEVEIEAPVSLLITGAALAAKLNSTTGRTSVELTYTPVDANDFSDDEPDENPDAKPTSIILCNLIPEKIEQSLLNITIPGENKVTIKVIGKNVVHLTGNYIDDDEDLSPSEGDEDDDDDDDEGYALDEISSDVEMDPDMLDDVELTDNEERAHIEEVEEEEEKEVKAKPASTTDSKKRSRESSAGEEEVSKKQLKKLAKKMKAENGEATPAPVIEAKEEKSDKKAEKKGKKEEKKEEGKGLVTSSTGLKTKDVKAGEGKKAKKGDLVYMRYIGKLPNGTTFDSNTKGKPFQFRLGAGEVIKGWDEGVAGMTKGGERLIIVPPQLGYGKKSSGPIPGNSTLHFEVKLLDIKN